MQIYQPLMTLLRSFERATGLQCCFRPMNNTWRRTNRFLTGRLLIHPSSFCQPFRTHQLRQCIRWDSDMIYELLTLHQTPFVRTCHAGADEILVPVYWQGHPVLVVFLGQFRRSDEQPESLPLWSEAKINHTLTLATALQTHLAAMYEECLAQLPAPTDPRLTQTLQWLHANLERDPTLDDVARFLGVSPTWASHLLRKLAEKPYSQIKDEVRLKRAQDLLAHSSMKIATIAASVGIQDVSYFSRFFKTRTGLTASEYRQAHRDRADA